MDRTSTPAPEGRTPTVQPRTGHFSTQSRANAEIEGISDRSDAEQVINRGGQAIEAMGNDLGRASGGNLIDVDVESARQRMRDCQSALVGLGYHLGHGEDPADGIDGVFDATTREAVRQFQEDNDLETHGRMDRDTYETLLRAFEQAMSMRADGVLGDGFGYVQGEQPIGNFAEGDEAALSAEEALVDDSDATLLALQDELDAGTAPSELEDL